jgi:hypothetical protein
MPAFPNFSLPHIALPHFTVLGNILSVLLSIFAIYFIFLISYCAVRIFEIRKKEKEHLEHEIALYAEHKKEHKNSLGASEERSKNMRWNKVLQLIFSENSANWRLAIVEADSMLDTLMSQIGFKGENLGERLKNADRDRFDDLTLAWEAHNVRNKIAHEGSSFEVSKHEARRVIAIYETIFRGFSFI